MVDSDWELPKDYVKIVNLDYQSGSCDWEKAETEGVKGAIFEFKMLDLAQVKEAARHGIPVGYFIRFLEEDYEEQATTFVRTFDDISLPFNLDIWISAEYESTIKRAAQILSIAFPGRVGVRASKGWWERKFDLDPYWSTLKLWTEQWNTGIDAPDKFRDWNRWTLWQYSADGNNKAAVYGFRDGSVDLGLNYYNGTFHDYQREYLLDPLTELEKRIKVLELQLTKAVHKADEKAFKAMPKVLEEMSIRLDQCELDIHTNTAAIEELSDALNKYEIANRASITAIEEWIGAFKRTS